MCREAICAERSDESFDKDFSRKPEFLASSKEDAGFDYNTKLVEYVIRMVAFINKHYPLSRSLYLWSDYDDLASGRKPLSGRLLYGMPSDEELLKISLEARRMGLAIAKPIA